MASGLGKRFGSNKLMADFGGRPLIAHILSTTGGLFQNRVVVTRHESVAAYCNEQKIPYVLHSLPLRSDTVRLGIQALSKEAEAGTRNGYIFCQGDQPLLSRETLQRLCHAAMTFPDRMIRPVSQGTVGSPILFPAAFQEELCHLPDGKGGGYLAKKYPEQVYLVPVREAFELKDIDTPSDLTALLSCLNGIFPSN